MSSLLPNVLRQGFQIMKYRLICCALFASLQPTLGAHAQALPDAGSVREQTTQAPPVPPRPVDLRLEGQPLLPEEQGGMRFQLKSVVLEGNTVIQTAELQAAIAAELGREVDFGGLRAVINKISQLYRERGYVFARAALPAQDIVGGVVRVVVLEGRYGQIRGVLNGQPTDMADAYLSGLRTGDVIEARSMERAALVLMELPGYQMAPVIRPSEAVGAGDLEFVIRETPRYSGSLRLDNHGGDSTGAHRLLASVARYRNFVPGDQLQLDALVSDGRTELLNAQYSRPLGGQGLRLSAGWSHSAYRLSGVTNFNDGEFRGSSEVLTLGLAYPLVRDRRTSVTLHAAVVLGRYQNVRPAVDNEHYASTALPISLRFSRLDDVAGGGTMFGAVTVTSGRISDRANYFSPATLGSFSKLAVDVVRIQRLGDRFSGYARLTSQFSGNPLDSSERISAGGANGVRAFPAGEGSADRGVLAQLEVRYQTPFAGLQPYAFLDTARMTTLSAEGSSKRGLTGHGFGLRWQNPRLSADLSAAWAGHTGLAPEQAAQLKKPRYWFSLNYAF